MVNVERWRCNEDVNVDCHQSHCGAMPMNVGYHQQPQNLGMQIWDTWRISRKENGGELVAGVWCIAKESVSKKVSTEKSIIPEALQP